MKTIATLAATAALGLAACAPANNAPQTEAAATASKPAPQLNYAALPVGRYAIYREDSGALIRTTVIKNSDGEHIYETRRGEAGDGKLMSRVVHDASGERLSWADSANTWRFEPNGCYRVIGSCNYTAVKDATGERYRNTVRGEKQGERHVWRRFYQGREVSSGWSEFDAETGFVSKYSTTGTDSSSGELVRFGSPE